MIIAAHLLVSYLKRNTKRYQASASDWMSDVRSINMDKRVRIIIDVEFEHLSREEWEAAKADLDDECKKERQEWIDTPMVKSVGTAWREI